MINKGNTINNFYTTPACNVNNPNPAKIFNKACPDVIFANKRTAKLIILDKLEINSILIINGARTKGVPAGIK